MSEPEQYPSEHRRGTEFFRKLEADHPNAINRFVAMELRKMNKTELSQQSLNDTPPASSMQHHNQVLANDTDLQKSSSPHHGQSIATEDIRKQQEASSTSIPSLHDVLQKVCNDKFHLFRLYVLLFIPYIAARFSLSFIWIILLTMSILYSIYHQRRRIALHHAVQLQSQCINDSYYLRTKFLQHTLHHDNIPGTHVSALLYIVTHHVDILIHTVHHGYDSYCTVLYRMRTVPYAVLYCIHISPCLSFTR
jgi:hypothetical protein